MNFPVPAYFMYMYRMSGIHIIDWRLFSTLFMLTRYPPMAKVTAPRNDADMEHLYPRSIMKKNIPARG
jgi:hypothetical protein